MHKLNAVRMLQNDMLQKVADIAQNKRLEIHIYSGVYDWKTDTQYASKAVKGKRQCCKMQVNYLLH